jgi:hypothetical protein
MQFDRSIEVLSRPLGPLAVMLVQEIAGDDGD